MSDHQVDLFTIAYLILITVIFIARLGLYEKITKDYRQSRYIQIGAALPIKKTNYDQSLWKLISISNILLYIFYTMLIFSFLVAVL